MPKTPLQLSRRDYLKTAALSGLAGAFSLSGARAESKASAPQGKGRARNLIFMVADGMGQGALAAANHYLNLTENRDSEWMKLYREGVARRSLMETSSASSVVTDSAAASSSWGCGQRVRNGAINTTASGQALTPLYTYARQAGLRTGLVTTARITHATPAGFAANVAKRSEEDTIAQQYLERQVDVLFGGGSKHFDATSRPDGRDLWGDFQAEGYAVARSRQEFDALPKGTFQRTLGVFSRSHLPFSVDTAHDEKLRAQVPPLTDLMRQALSTLNASGERFVLQVEAGRVDHGGHASDPAALLFDQLEFDRCIALARDFAEQDGETLVIVTADHGTGGFMLNGYGPNYSLSAERFQQLGRVKSSFEQLLKRLPKTPSPEQVAAAVHEQLGVALSPQALDYVMLAFRPSEGAPPIEFTGRAINLGTVLSPILLDAFAINWTSQNHTAEEVEFACFGPGAERIPGWFENWEAHGYVREALQI